ncbi:MAG: transporter substrate-binding domain-containing protein [Desulfobacterales bacterium]|nr:transporter substrate-binding domain-containing protein [Desulfobacterales bacterium]
MFNTFKKYTLIFLIIFLSLPLISTAMDNHSIDSLLTKEEKEFLAKAGTIRVHNESDWAPFNFNENNSPKGFSIDYMKLLAQKVGLEIRFINGPSWNEFLDMIKKGELDVMLVVLIK